ncbi:TlpA family protein disulfide reductase [Amycolatopsis sp. NPDC101161]|uniref:TlpA family protein disulfide reductase n=1 Tax=Amycolatopsis sp. NPDC101161 TaxID=3363940 RepID=UPI003813BC1D
MSFLVAVVAVLAVLTVLNLLLSAAIIRLLNEQRRPALPALPAAGTEIGAFEVTDADGATVTDRELDDALVAFLSPTCGPCRRLAGELTEPAVAFIIDGGDRDAAVEYAAGLGPAVRVAFVGDRSPVAAAFGAGDVTPTLIRVRDRRITAAGHDLDAVRPQPVR